MRIWGIPGQVVRIVILFAVALVVLVVVRVRFIPPTFGELGHYRAEALTVNAERPVRYAGLAACAECHTDEAEIKNTSYHRGLTCEGCHGPAAGHAEDPTEVQPLVPREREACLRCHDYRSSRPTGFPQVIATTHNPVEPCMTCHDPHEPTPPETPGECSACHAAIANMKAVSHHQSLECTTCHEAPPEHLVAPRTHVPTKPAGRDFCGRCHDPDAASSAEIPRVDLIEHGGRYLCWQCHYPHDPEAK